ncbi:hypothetical protein PhaeoP75_03838 (plasmid) [Phaeobacter gallaeciensis]|uniref:Copper chaperone PCu(A)C n=1 Tax=Phaeobacter gallaeciensis TaxID=60890 RepID=A0AAD0EER9_9RHOB|nr:hypothetical protein [Phaeobacter gallaeciensis]AHD11512.1 hypothetical protein Gal_03803 [Phaeobacter gallaeciensis DSM 26640]ATE94776.1 hypothetical protein PhaeoP11_03789 [Phaeobacter gallaeciensis]ATE99048.1 hypothetical protein PhaeoP73_03786 [Phaeobacter gallaeciensis]ATF03440.1 hypothetical protein PhaeoP75_03838 [Phaeobacter gallaeciensis]ATF07820.1 hypothetical protein PhaeoP63_03787 [Phaeobacter gallaeciensis]
MLRRVFYISMLAATPLIVICACLPQIKQLEALPAQLFVTLPAHHPQPDLQVSSIYNAEDGWRLRIEVENFTFTDLCVSNATDLARGHAHVHLGNKKLATAYQPDIVLRHLPTGQHQVTVSLRTQDHRVLGRQEGGIFAATVTINAL